MPASCSGRGFAAASGLAPPRHSRRRRTRSPRRQATALWSWVTHSCGVRRSRSIPWTTFGAWGGSGARSSGRRGFLVPKTLWTRIPKHSGAGTASPGSNPARPLRPRLCEAGGAGGARPEPNRLFPLVRERVGGLGRPCAKPSLPLPPVSAKSSGSALRWRQGLGLGEHQPL